MCLDFHGNLGNLLSFQRKPDKVPWFEMFFFPMFSWFPGYKNTLSTVQPSFSPKMTARSIRLMTRPSPHTMPYDALIIIIIIIIRMNIIIIMIP